VPGTVVTFGSRCQTLAVLDLRTWALADGLSLADVACRHAQGRGAETEQAGQYAVVFVRRGCFVRNSAGGEHLLDPTLAYCMRAGDEQRYDHPHAHGDDCTAVFLSPELVASTWGGELDLPSAPVPVTSAVDIRHRRLLVAARHGSDGDGLAEAAISLVADALDNADCGQVASGRPAAAKQRAALVDGVRERLAADADWTLTELAAALAVSPHHLSRTFRAVTGETVSRHRMRIRTRMALDRLVGGEHDLAWIAAQTGFADQSHLCRVLRSETAATPSSLRAVLAS
jgi:AraC-like DNA-binding protein